MSVFVLPESVLANKRSGTIAGRGDSVGGSGTFLLHAGDLARLGVRNCLELVSGLCAEAISILGDVGVYNFNITEFVLYKG